MIDAMVNGDEDQIVVVFEPSATVFSSKELDKRAVRSGHFGISQRGRYNFVLPLLGESGEPDMAYIRRRSDRDDHKPEKFVDQVCRIKVIL